MHLQTVSLEVKFSPEDNKLFLLAFRLLTKEMILIKVTPQLVVILIEILQPVRFTEVTGFMNLPKMFEQGLTVKESLITELTKRMTWDNIGYRSFKRKYNKTKNLRRQQEDRMKTVR